MSIQAVELLVRSYVDRQWWTETGPAKPEFKVALEDATLPIQDNNRYNGLAGIPTLIL
jgi:hypothetical protein